MPTRRKFVAALASTAAIAVLALPFAANAAPPTVEIIALPHSPVQTALKPVRDFLAGLGSKVKVVEIDAESPAGEKRLSALGLQGHVPILLAINGSDQFKRPDGTAVLFKDFPAQPGQKLGSNGLWSVADLEAAVNQAIGKAAN